MIGGKNVDMDSRAMSPQGTRALLEGFSNGAPCLDGGAGKAARKAARKEGRKEGVHPIPKAEGACSCEILGVEV